MGGAELSESKKKSQPSELSAQTDQKIAPIYCNRGRRIHLDYIHNSSILWIDGARAFILIECGGTEPSNACQTARFAVAKVE